MKTLYALALAVSLVINVTAAWLLLMPAPPATAPTTVAARGSGAVKVDGETWSKLGGDDLADLAAKLRASGFPPEMVRAILAARLGEEFAARRKALSADNTSMAFWKNQQNDPKVQAALRQLDREQQKRLRELLGADADPTDPMSLASRGRSFNYLPTEKADEVRRLLRDFDDRRNDLYASGFDYNVDRDKMRTMEKAQHDAIAAVLTPAELLDYDLRTSTTATSLRDTLSAFNPTEEEFRAIYQLRVPFDERFNTEFMPGMTQEEMRARSEAEKSLTGQIKAALTPDRAAEYDRATDYNYRRTAQLITRLDLPTETTNSLYAVQKEFEQRRMDVTRAAPNAAERVTQLTALQQEAIARVTPLLGNAAYIDTYKQYGGNWLQNMVPRQPPGKK